MPPIALSEGALPSSHQLSLRLSQLAKAYDLTLAPDATSEIGEFLAVGMNSHLGDVVNTLVRVTGRNRRGVDTIHMPTSSYASAENGHHDSYPDGRDREQRIEHDIPKPDLETMQSLFHLAPELHTQASPALYKLQSSHTSIAQEVKDEPTSPPAILQQARAGAESTKRKSPPKSSIRQGMHSKSEATRERLLRQDLFKLEPGRQEGEGKKDRKHNLHWKYEDPAVIFQDLLG
jgi:transcriptional coactivator HFI1/ADA1